MTDDQQHHNIKVNELDKRQTELEVTVAAGFAETRSQITTLAHSTETQIGTIANSIRDLAETQRSFLGSQKTPWQSVFAGVALMITVGLAGATGIFTYVNITTSNIKELTTKEISLRTTYCDERIKDLTRKYERLIYGQENKS